MGVAITVTCICKSDKSWMQIEWNAIHPNSNANKNLIKKKVKYKNAEEEIG